jgi:hypothetical protein
MNVVEKKKNFFSRDKKFSSFGVNNIPLWWSYFFHSARRDRRSARFAPKSINRAGCPQVIHSALLVGDSGSGSACGSEQCALQEKRLEEGGLFHHTSNGVNVRSFHKI